MKEDIKDIKIQIQKLLHYVEVKLSTIDDDLEE